MRPFLGAKLSTRTATFITLSSRSSKVSIKSCGNQFLSSSGLVLISSRPCQRATALTNTKSRFEADADLDQLGPSARRDLIAAVSRHATAEDVGLGIDALAEPYFLEVDQALDAEGVPPAMQAVIESYFESLQAPAPNTEATP